MTGKGSFYIAQYPVRWTAQSALHFLPSLADLFIPTPFSASPGSILAMQQLCATTKSLTFPPLSIARYSFIQLSQQGRQWREGKCPIFQTVAKGDSNSGSLDCESGVLPLATALHVVPLTSATDTLLIAINCKWLQSIEMSCVINFLALPFLCVPSACVVQHQSGNGHWLVSPWFKSIGLHLICTCICIIGCNVCSLCLCSFRGFAK